MPVHVPHHLLAQAHATPGGMHVRQRPPLAWPAIPDARRAAWPAALLSAAVAVAAVTEGSGPRGAWVAVGLAAAVALPFAALALVEGRLQRQAMHVRAGQIAQLRFREAWQRMSAWEVCDAVALLLRNDGVRVDWLPAPFEAGDAFFGVIGASREGRPLVVRILRERLLDAAELAQAVGRAVLSGAGHLVVVALEGSDLPKSLDPPRAPGRLAIEVLREGDILARAEELAPSDAKDG